MSRARGIGQADEDGAMLASGTLAIGFAVGLAISGLGVAAIAIRPGHALGAAPAFTVDPAWLAIGNASRLIFCAVHARQFATTHELATQTRRAGIVERVAIEVRGERRMLAASEARQRGRENPNRHIQ